MSHKTVNSVRFEPWHALKIELRDLEKKDISGVSLWALAKKLENSEIAHTIFSGDAVVGCGGVYLDEYGQGCAWIFTSDLINKYALSGYKMVKHQLSESFRLGCTRVQTYVLAENVTSIRFLERLGFKREGLLRKCLHNKLDRYIYARLAPWEH